MGYIIFEKFNDIYEWGGETLDSDYGFLEHDWSGFTLGEDKGVFFRAIMEQEKTISIRKKYPEPVKIVYTLQDRTEIFPVLHLCRFYYDSSSRMPIRLEGRKDFPFKLGIYNQGKLLREWLVPQSTLYRHHIECFDLQPLIDDGITEFDEIEITALRAFDTKYEFFVGMALYQEEMEHNVLQAFQDLLNEQIKVEVGSVGVHGHIGDSELRIMTKGYLIDYGYAFRVGNSVHSVGNLTYDDGVAVLSLSGEFAGKNLVEAAPVGTPVYFIVPAIYGNLSETEFIVPCFFITTSHPDREENEETKLGEELDSYVLGNPDMVSTRLSSDAVNLTVNVHIYAPTPELAAEMNRMLNKIIDRQSHIHIGFKIAEYKILDSNKLNVENDVLEVLPHYQYTLSVSAVENIHTRHYRPFPNIRKIDITNTVKGA